MSYNNEITVKVTVSYEALHQELVKKGFRIIAEFTLKDQYLIPQSWNEAVIDRDAVSKESLMIRVVDGHDVKLLHKFKQLNADGTVSDQDQLECEVQTYEKALAFMKSLAYKPWVILEDVCTVYTDERIEIIVQNVNHKYVFIEMESVSKVNGIKYSSFESMKTMLDSYQFPYGKEDYFVRKLDYVWKSWR